MKNDARIIVLAPCFESARPIKSVRCDSFRGVVWTMKVFVSDRYPPVQERLVGMIASIEGVEIVGQPEDNMEAVERLEPDVMVLDVRTGVMAQLSKLRQSKARNHSPVVIVLADQPSFSRPKLLSGGADFVFHRSYEFEQLLELIKAMSGRRQSCNED